MKIVGMELYEVSIPFVKAYSTAYFGTSKSHSNIVCKLKTEDENITGFGEGCPIYPVFTTESCESITKCAANNIFPLLNGINALDIDNAEKIMDSSVTDDNIIAKGMINMALWDIYGKYHNKPVYQCLADIYNNGKVFNPSIPLLYPFGDQSIEDDYNSIKEKWSQGYRTFMLKMGSNLSEFDINYQISRVMAVNSSEFGPIGKDGKDGKDGEDGIKIICDANQGFTYDESIKFIDGCKDIKLTAFEQPIDKYDYINLKKLSDYCNKIDSKFNIALDESVQSFDTCKECIDNQISNIYSVKVSKNGGINKLYDMCKLCELNNVDCYFNSQLEFGVAQAGLLSVASNVQNILRHTDNKLLGHCFMSTLRFSDDVTDFKSNISENMIANVSNKPGLGVNIDDNKLDQYTTKTQNCTF